MKGKNATSRRRVGSIPRWRCGVVRAYLRSTLKSAPKAIFCEVVAAPERMKLPHHASSVSSVRKKRKKISRGSEATHKICVLLRAGAWHTTMGDAAVAAWQLHCRLLSKYLSTEKLKKSLRSAVTYGTSTHNASTRDFFEHASCACCSELRMLPRIQLRHARVGINAALSLVDVKN